MENKRKRVFSTAEDGRSRDWSDLPADLLLLILRHLNFLDHLSFFGVCKSWRWALEQCTLENQLPAQPYWVISRKMSTSTDIIWHFGDSSTRRSYTINVPELSQARCLVSKHGWLLLFSSEPISSLFFFNPFSRARIDLPWTISESVPVAEGKLPGPPMIVNVE
ncbi:F-box protein At4g12382-like isoform X2 [Camellia sinensis]|uniref:F-box protein At4g12382-like isoform X2 n=1 Tax=Camellia sinensis TaxID=4442 RepID=UPI00103662A0|nr:F-box protein At4g12382-like isoform X2 [Camellia sinensis]